MSIIRGRFMRLLQIGQTLGLGGNRYKSGCGYKSPKSECSPENNRCKKIAIKKGACADGKPSSPSKKKNPPATKAAPLKLQWENPECRVGPCPDPPPKFDWLCYKPTNKLTRKYQQTWNDCPPRRVVQKVICEYPKFKMPPLEKRKRCPPPTAKPPCSPAALSYMACDTSKQLKQNKKCLKLTMAGCKEVRSPPYCKVYRGPSLCQKLKCPYPAFSECSKPKPNPRRPHECDCLGVRSLCQAYTILRMKGRRI